MRREGCNCIQDGGDGRIRIVTSDLGVIPWRCPNARKCSHLKRMSDRIEAEAWSAPVDENEAH